MKVWDGEDWGGDNGDNGDSGELKLRDGSRALQHVGCRQLFWWAGMT